MPGSSPEEIKDDVVAQAETPVVETKSDVDPAASSSAEVKSEKGDLLSAVKAALEPKTEKALASDEPGPKSEDDPDKVAAKEGAEAGEESDDLSEEELNRLRPKTRKRIDNLLKDRADRDRQLTELTPKAEQFDKINSFVESANLSKQEVNDGFGVMADLKNRPERAYATLKPIMAQLAAMFGEGDLPADIQQDVNFGRITEARARELVAARSQSTLVAEREQRNEQQNRVQREQQAHQSRVDEAANAVTEWDNSKAKTDPSWKLKQPRVGELIELEINRRQRANPEYFPTKAEALTFAKDALTKVENDLKAYAPKLRQINAPPDAGSTSATTAPKSTLEAARKGLAAARA